MARWRTIDRRLAPRFEVVGDLWGSLQVRRVLSIVDVGASGALVESERLWEVGSVLSVGLADSADFASGQVCVKHVRVGPAGNVLMGVEFLSMTPALAAEVARWAGAGESMLEHSGG